MGLCCSDRSHGGRGLSLVVTCGRDFEQPVEPLGSAASGVRFFRLVPVAGDCSSDEGAGEASPGAAPPGAGGRQWLGKDYAHAFDELEFYNACHRLRGRPGQEQWRIFDFLPSFHGIVRHASCLLPGADAQRIRTTDLLVFRSPLEGLARPRLLNVEVGPSTSALQYRRGSEVDAVMFARQEGVRVEGFMSPPRSIPGEDPGLDAKGWTWGDTTQRRAKRGALQALRPGEALAAFVDLRDAIMEERLWPSEGCDGSGRAAASAFAAQFLGPAEYSELALLHVVKELASLLRASASVPVPQKWVGSSVGLLVEAGVAPPRTGPIDPQTWVAARVKLRIFGWSRSKVSDPGSALTADEQQDHETLWQIYRDSLGCVLWEASRLYFHAFCAREWTDLCVEVYELSARGESMLLGTAGVRLDAELKEARALPLLAAGVGEQVCGPDGSPSRVRVATSLSACGAPSRLAGVWRVQLDSASDLPLPRGAAAAAGAAAARSEVFAIVSVREQTSLGSRRASQRTRPDANRLQPAWREEFEFPVVAAGGVAVERLGEALGCSAGAGAGPNLAKHLLQPMPRAVDGADGACEMAALGQMAFIMELRAGWMEQAREAMAPGGTDAAQPRAAQL
mmetsp:Transcript_107537/g.334329  ORF Transcript_107537/g.334329 Transcript_107537/m.334329 type:complete len:623 (-) Transcript_107537:384-2252(-)